MEATTTTTKPSRPFLTRRTARVAGGTGIDPTEPAHVVVEAAAAQQVAVDAYLPDAPSSTMLLYLSEQQDHDSLRGIFSGTKDSMVMVGVSRADDDPDSIARCWRFAAGRAAYFGPAPYRQISDPDGPYVTGPGSIWLDAGAECASWGQDEISGVWERWNAEERQVYTDVRAAGLEVAAAWFREGGHDPEQCCGDIEIRTMCARYAANAVQRFRLWRHDALGEGRKA